MSQQSQIFDGAFREIDTNFIYGMLINNKIVKPPHQNNSFRSVFTATNKEIGDKKNCYLNKRDGMTKLKLWNVDGQGEYTEELGEWIFWDTIDIDNSVYFFATTRDETKMRIYKLCNLQYDEFGDYDRCAGLYVNISRYDFINSEGGTDTLDYYPFQKGLSKKFVANMNLKNQKECGTYQFGIRYAAPGDPSQLEFYVNDQNGQPVNMDLGDFIMVTNGNSALAGYVFEHTYTTTDNKTGLYSSAPQGWTPIPQTHVEKACIFGGYGSAFSFTTLDGIVNWSGDQCTPQSLQTYYSPGTYYNSMGGLNTQPPRLITSVVSYQNALFYYDKKNGYVVPSYQGINKNAFRTLMASQVNTQYTDMNVFQDFLLLIGPNEMGYVTFNWNATLQTRQSQRVELSNHNGYHNTGSWINVDDNFYVVRDSQELYGLSLQNTGLGVKPIFTLLSTFLNTDLKKMNRSFGDRIYLDVEGNDIDIYLTNQSGDCQIMRYNAFYKIWHKWIVTGGIELNSSYKGLFLGNGLYCNKGDTDQGEEIIQIINMTFGDMTDCNEKVIPWIKLRIGHNSNIDKDTQVNFKNTSGGLDTDWISHIHKTNYVYCLNKSKDTNRFSDVHYYDSGLCINTGIGIGNDQVYNTLKREIQEYKMYRHKPTPENVQRVAKYGVLEIPLSIHTDILFVELIAYAKNNVEFGGFYFAYDYIGPDATRFEDVVSDNDLEPTSGVLINPFNLYPNYND